jgi:hypothetical protein
MKKTGIATQVQEHAALHPHFFQKTSFFSKKD